MLRVAEFNSRIKSKRPKLNRSITCAYTEQEAFAYPTIFFVSQATHFNESPGISPSSIRKRKSKQITRKISIILGYFLQIYSYEYSQRPNIKKNNKIMEFQTIKRIKKCKHNFFPALFSRKPTIGTISYIKTQSTPQSRNLIKYKKKIFFVQIRTFRAH